MKDYHAYTEKRDNHAGPLKEGIGFTKEQPAYDGGCRSRQAENQHGHPCPDFNQGLEKENVSQEKTDNAGQAEINPGMGRKVKGNEKSVPDQKEKAEKNKGKEDPDDIHRGGSNPSGGSFKKLGTHGPAQHGCNGDQFTGICHWSPF